jgi:hypothetical protein
MKLNDDQVLSGHNDLEKMRRPHLWPSTVLHLKLWDVRTHTYRAFALLSHKDGIWTFTPKMKLDAFSELISRSRKRRRYLLKKWPPWLIVD